MRVLHVLAAGERGGAERVLSSLLRHAGTSGVEPSVAALASGPFVDELDAAGIDVVRLPPAPRTRSLHRLPRAAREVARVADDRRVDVVQGNGERCGLLAALAARWSGRPSVVWLHDAPARSAAAIAVQLAARVARPTAWVAGSRWMADDFQRRLRVPVRLIPLGVELDDLDAAVDVNAVAGFPPGTTTVTFVGRLQRWKGADVFLRAAAIVARAQPGVGFVVAGGALFRWEEEFAASLPALADELGIADAVRLLGHRDDAQALMAGSDVVVHASVRPEPLGLVVAEAMALGRAVIATRTRGPEELIDHDRSGVLVPPGDPTALADAITGLVVDGNRRRRLGDAAADAIRARWSSVAMAAGFAELYRELAPT